MLSVKKMWRMFTAAAVLAMAAALMVPALAFGVTNVTVNYTNAAGVSRTTVVDLDALPANTQAYGYMFQRNGTNNVVKADKTVTLAAVVNAAKAQNGDAADTTVWAAGKVMTFVCDGAPYTKYTDFSFARLSAPGYFWGDTISTGGVLGTGSLVPTVLALQSASQAMDPTDDVTTAGEVLDGIATSTATSPRLLWGWPSSTIPADQLGGNRYPSNIESITIS